MLISSVRFPGKRIVIFVLLGMLFFATSGRGEESQPEKIPEALKPLLTTLGPGTLEQTRKEIDDLQATKDTMNAKMSTIIEESFKAGYTDNVWFALEAVGRYHLTELAPLCIRHLTEMEPEHPVMERYRTGNELAKVAAKSLIQIGSPAVPQLLADIARGGGILPEHARHVINEIYGKKVGAIVIRDAINAQSDPKAKARLEELFDPNYVPAEDLTEPESPEPPGPQPHDVPPQPATQEKPATEPSEETAPPAQTVSPAPAAGFPWYASGIIGLVLGAAATFALTRKK